MDKQQFLEAIRDGLNGLPQSDIEKYLDYYSEMIEDRMEDGASQEEAVASMESVEEIVRQILPDVSSTQTTEEQESAGHSLRPWEVVLLVLGSPLWLSLALAGFFLILAFYIILWSVVLVFYAVDLVFAAAGVSGIAAGITLPFSGMHTQAVFLLGIGLVCAGIAILLFFAFYKVTRGMAVLSKKIICRIRTLFQKRRKAQ